MQDWCNAAQPTQPSLSHADGCAAVSAASIKTVTLPRHYLGFILESFYPEVSGAPEVLVVDKLCCTTMHIGAVEGKVEYGLLLLAGTGKGSRGSRRQEVGNG